MQAILDENRLVEHYTVSENHNISYNTTITTIVTRTTADNRCSIHVFSRWILCVFLLRLVLFDCAWYTLKNFTSACERHKSYQMLRWEYCNAKQLKNESLFVSTHSQRRMEREVHGAQGEWHIGHPKFSSSDALNNVAHTYRSSYRRRPHTRTAYLQMWRLSMRKSSHTMCLH